MSAIIARNRTGLRTVSWGTPLAITLVSLFPPGIWRYCEHPLRNCDIHIPNCIVHQSELTVCVRECGGQCDGRHSNSLSEPYLHIGPQAH